MSKPVAAVATVNGPMATGPSVVIVRRICAQLSPVSPAALASMQGSAEQLGGTREIFSMPLSGRAWLRHIHATPDASAAWPQPLLLAGCRPSALMASVATTAEQLCVENPEEVITATVRGQHAIKALLRGRGTAMPAVVLLPGCPWLTIV
jgi:hypothetical protein